MDLKITGTSSMENKKVTITMMILTHDFEHDDSDVVIDNDYAS